MAKSTPGPGGSTSCLDLLAIKTWTGPPLTTAQNSTRISRDGFTFCKNAFQLSSGTEADIVFIYDNSGSMAARYAYINPGKGDTSFYYGFAGCTSGATSGTLTIPTQVGPRVVPLLASNAGCSQHSGDPYAARGEAIKQAVDFMSNRSPKSTIGIVGFNDNIVHTQQSLPLNDPASSARIKAAVVLDTTNLGTQYGKPLRQATVWLNDPAVIKTNKQAIVFLSDGAPDDTTAQSNYVGSIPQGIPIYSIFLGDPSADFRKLQDLSTRTGGTFYRVDPNDVSKMADVMQEIIRAIVVTSLPSAVEITNNSMSPIQTSRSVSMTPTAADSNISVVMDSILGLKQGVNDITVKIIQSDSTSSFTYSFKIQADGPTAPGSNSSLICYDQPTLVMLNATNQVDSVYARGPATYNVRLTRSPSDIGTVTIAATSNDSTQGPAWGDAETIILPVTSNAGAVTTNQRNDYPFNGSIVTPTKGNAVLEAAANGSVVLSWAHPRDPRETASFRLPAKVIPTLPGFISVERVISVPKGILISAAVPDPIVIRGGAVLNRLGPDSAAITTQGCLYNCTDNSLRNSDPIKTPSFVFKTASPFSFQLKMYDNLGHFILKDKGTINAVEWQNMPKIGDSVAVVMSVIPVASNGQLLSTGVYILSVSLTTTEMAGNNPAFPTKISAVSRGFINKFGYIRAPQK